MPARKGLLAPQNTFLDTIATRFDGTHANFVIGNAKITRVYPIVYCSDGFCELTGYSRAQIMQKSCACNFLYGQKTDVQHKDAISKALNQKQEVKLELILYKSSGTPFWCLLDICGIQNEMHEVVLILCAYKDITKEKFHAQQRQLALANAANAHNQQLHHQHAAVDHHYQQQPSDSKQPSDVSQQQQHHHHNQLQHQQLQQQQQQQQQVAADKSGPAGSQHDTGVNSGSNRATNWTTSLVANSQNAVVHQTSHDKQDVALDYGASNSSNGCANLNQANANDNLLAAGDSNNLPNELAGAPMVSPLDDKALISMDEFGLEEGDESEDDHDKHTTSQYSRRRSRAVLYQLSGHYGGGNPRSVGSMKSKLKLNNRINIPEYKTTTITKKKFILSHYGLIKSCWDWLILIVTFYVAIVVPYNAAFKGEQELSANCEMDISDIIVEIVFVIDVILNFRTTFVNRKGEVVTKPRIICRHYVKGWFVVDACAALPFDMLCRLNLSGRKMDRYSQYSYIILTLLMLIFSLLAHWCACIWYVIAREEIERHRSEANWKIGWLHQLSDKLGQSVLNGTDLASSYVTALYFTTSSLTSVGFGNVSANTNAEKIFSIVIMLIGALMHAVVFGNVTALIRVMYAKRSNYQTRLRDLKDFFRLHQLPKELQQRMSDYFQTTWSLNHGIEISEILKDFPEELRGDVSLHLHREVLDLPIFNTAPQGFLKSLARHIESKFCCPTEYLIHRGDALNYLYLVCNGSMEVLQDNMVVGILGKGDLVGYDVNAMISPEHTQFGLNKVTNALAVTGLVKSSSDLKALTYCDLKCIHISGLLEVLKLYPEFSDTFHNEIMHDLSFNLRETHEPGEDEEGEDDDEHDDEDDDDDGDDNENHDDQDQDDDDDESEHDNHGDRTGREEPEEAEEEEFNDSHDQPSFRNRPNGRKSPPPPTTNQQQTGVDSNGNGASNPMGRLYRLITAAANDESRTIGRYDVDEVEDDDDDEAGDDDDDDDNHTIRHDDDDLDQVEEEVDEEEEANESEESDTTNRRDDNNDSGDDQNGGGGGGAISTSGGSNNNSYVDSRQQVVGGPGENKQGGSAGGKLRGEDNRCSDEVQSLDNWRQKNSSSNNNDNSMSEDESLLFAEGSLGRRQLADLEWHHSNSYETVCQAGRKKVSACASNSNSSATTGCSSSGSARLAGGGGNGNGNGAAASISNVAPQLRQQRRTITKNHHSEETILADKQLAMVKSHDSIKATNSGPVIGGSALRQPLKSAIGNRQQALSGSQTIKKPPLAFDLSRNTTALVDRRRRSAGCIPRPLLAGSNLLAKKTGPIPRRAPAVSRNTHASLTHINEGYQMAANKSSSGSKSQQQQQPKQKQSRNSNRKLATQVSDIGCRSSSSRPMTTTTTKGELLSKRASQQELRSIDEHMTNISASVRELRQDMNEFRNAMQILMQVVANDKSARNQPPEAAKSASRRKLLQNQAPRFAQSTSNLTVGTSLRQISTGILPTTATTPTDAPTQPDGRSQLQSELSAGIKVALLRSQSANSLSVGLARVSADANYGGQQEVLVEESCESANIGHGPTDGPPPVTAPIVSGALPVNPTVASCNLSVTANSSSNQLRPVSECSSSPLTPTTSGAGVCGANLNSDGDSGRSSSSVASTMASSSTFNYSPANQWVQSTGSGAINWPTTTTAAAASTVTTRIAPDQQSAGARYAKLIVAESSSDAKSSGGMGDYHTVDIGGNELSASSSSSLVNHQAKQS